MICITEIITVPVDFVMIMLIMFMNNRKKFRHTGLCESVSHMFLFHLSFSFR